MGGCIRANSWVDASTRFSSTAAYVRGRGLRAKGSVSGARALARGRGAEAVRVTAGPARTANIKTAAAYWNGLEL